MTIPRCTAACAMALSLAALVGCPTQPVRFAPPDLPPELQHVVDNRGEFSVTVVARPANVIPLAGRFY